MDIYLKNKIVNAGEQELRDMNALIVLRLKSINTINGYKVAATLKLGDMVAFKSPRGVLTGVLEKINDKTVNVNTPTGGWKVALNLVRKVEHE